MNNLNKDPRDLQNQVVNKTIIEDNDLIEKKEKRLGIFEMRFFKKIQVANAKRQSDCLANGTVKRLETAEDEFDGGRTRNKEEDKGRVNEGFELIEAEGRKENSGIENAAGKNSKEESKEAAEGSGELAVKGVSEDERRCNRRGELWGKMSACMGHPRPIRWAALALVTLAAWTVVHFLAGSHFSPGSRPFGLVALFVLAYVGGALLKLIDLPPLLGMLLVGLLLRNVGSVHPKGVYVEVTAFLREVALCIILIRAGLGLDPKALRSLKFVILRLAAVPGMAEGTITAVVSHFLLGFPWLWGLLLGAILAAVSPAVVIPSLFSLQERGYGTGKGIPTLVVAAASLDDILAITVFGVVLNFIYSSGTSLTAQVVQGPLGIVSGIAFGVGWGFLARFVPHRDDGQVVFLRVLMMVGGGLVAIVGSGAFGCQGAGPLGCIVAAFVAASGWRQRDYRDGQNPVADVFRTIWSLFQPILFGLIGSEVDVSVLDASIIGNGVAALVCSLLGRIVVTVFIAFGAGFNWKEKTFIAWAWFPKATVQAALGPVALDLARRNGSEEDIDNARKVLVIAVLAILITAPLGATLIRVLGPKLLTKDTGRRSCEPEQLDEESRVEERNKT